MKKHMAICCGEYYPEPSATGRCVERFVNILAEDYDIDVLCISQDGKEQCVFFKNGVLVHTLSGKRWTLERTTAGAVRKLLYFAGCAQIKILMLGNLNWYWKRVVRKLEQLNKTRKYDVVFTISSPFAAHIAGMKFIVKHPYVTHCAYTVDPYSSKNRMRPFYCTYEKLVAYEKKAYTNIGSLLLSEEVYTFRKELYEKSSRYAVLPYILPELDLEQRSRHYFDGHDINCVYAGSFYQDIRNPAYMLKLFSLIQDSGVKLHLFSKGCENMVEVYTEKFSNIILHKRVSGDEMRQVYYDADILISIGNSTSEFMPSKIFEYIVTGKPIINFYYKGHLDTVLNKYPLCMQVENDSDYTETQKAVVQFIRESAKKSIDKNDIASLYTKNTRQAVAKVLNDAMV